MFYALKTLLICPVGRWDGDTSMMTTLILVGGTAVLTALYVATHRGSALQGAWADNTAVGLADLAQETMNLGHSHSQLTTKDWQIASLASLSDAEDLLDYLEANGYSQRELINLGNRCFAVRWR